MHQRAGEASHAHAFRFMKPVRHAREARAHPTQRALGSVLGTPGAPRQVSVQPERSTPAGQSRCRAGHPAAPARRPSASGGHRRRACSWPLRRPAPAHHTRAAAPRAPPLLGLRPHRRAPGSGPGVTGSSRAVRQAHFRRVGDTPMRADTTSRPHEPRPRVSRAPRSRSGGAAPRHPSRTAHPTRATLWF